MRSLDCSRSLDNVDICSTSRSFPPSPPMPRTTDPQLAAVTARLMSKTRLYIATPNKSGSDKTWTGFIAKRDDLFKEQRREERQVRHETFTPALKVKQKRPAKRERERDSTSPTIPDEHVAATSTAESSATANTNAQANSRAQSQTSSFSNVNKRFKGMDGTEQGEKNDEEEEDEHGQEIFEGGKWQKKEVIWEDWTQKDLIGWSRKHLIKVIMEESEERKKERASFEAALEDAKSRIAELEGENRKLMGLESFESQTKEDMCMDKGKGKGKAREED